LISANEAQSYQLAVNYGNWGKIMQYDLTQIDMLNNATSQISRSLTYPSHANNVGNSQTPFAPTMQNGDEDVFFTFGINGSLRKREVQTPNPHTEYYLFNSQGNLKAYSDDIMSFAYYGYNAANTRTYKISLYNTNVWINGQQQPLNMQLQNAMFYPNTYLNFDAFGNYTKHYYNGMERIASRLGDNTTTIAISNNILEDRKLQLEEQFRVDIHKLIYETVPIDLPPFMDVNALQPTGTPNDIFYYHPNHLGNTAFVTDQNQTITQGFLYAPFGEITTEYNVNFGNNVIPKYSFNAKELDEETGMYYYEARYYKPPVFTSRDPMFEKYFWMTPYAYCANNPVKYVDPSGRKVEPAGEEEANAYNEFKANAPDHVRAELTRLEDAEEVFRIRMGDNITCTAGEGNFVYNTTTEEFDINILDGSDYSTMEKLSHELKHADQYMDRKIGFDLKELTGIKGDIALPIPYDRRNEYEAYARQSLFSASGKVVSRQKIFESYPNLIEYKTPITIDNLDIPGYNFQGIKDHNSKVYNKYGKPRFMYHGWKDDIEK
ncbi:MAG: RHS repeat-associated core domain-containing protein, partial [Bacteroidales bacterium]|nr:RHS repeat-associated core domain-containing protein [Bacteroidales bacterium]